MLKDYLPQGEGQKGGWVVVVVKRKKKQERGTMQVSDESGSAQPAIARTLRYGTINEINLWTSLSHKRNANVVIRHIVMLR